MKKLLIEFEYDEKKLGKGWFNLDNLELCLFSQQHTKKELLKVKEKFLPDWKWIEDTIKSYVYQYQDRTVGIDDTGCAKAIAKRLEGK